MGAMATPVPAPRLRGREADLDHLRRVVGDRRLNYLGESTGTLIGLTYANLFPRKVRAVVLDGVEDPVRWMAGTASALAQSFTDTDRTWERFLALCEAAGPARSSCVQAAVGRYLADLTTPAPGTVCPSDRLPFDPEFGQPVP